MQAGPSSGGSSGAASGSGLAPNMAGAISYVVGFISGIVFLVLDKDEPFVRFHAWQSIIVSIVMTVAWIVAVFLSVVLAFIPIIGWLLIGLIYLVLGLGGLILWVALIVKAYQGERWKLPFVGDMAERYSAGH